MPSKAPQQKTPTFEELKSEALRRIPRYTPEWTNFNESDPGITLVELFCWLTEMMLEQMTWIPESSYVKFLGLLGLKQLPAQPATAHLVFAAQAGADVQSIEARTQVEAQPPSGGDPLVFETLTGLDLVRVPLSSVQVFDGTAFAEVTAANDEPDTPFRPLGWQPQIGSALYLGFEQTDPPAIGRTFPREIRLRVFLCRAAHSNPVCSCFEAEQPPAPPVTLVWEYRPTSATPRWQRLNVYEDETVAFTREGYIVLEGPARIEPTNEGKTKEPRFWLRCRVADGAYSTDDVPEIDLIRPNVVPAENLTTVRRETLGESKGHPDQVFECRFSPVLPASLELCVESESGESSAWEPVDDFLASGPDDPHYTLDAATGSVRFGDGRRGRIPVAGDRIVAERYRYGGGRAGNVGAGQINRPRTSLVGVESVENVRPAVGGSDRQDLEALKEQAPQALRNRNRAVTAEDFAELAGRAGGVIKATAIPLRHPEHPDDVSVPGAVTVAILPDSGDVPPRPSPDLIRHVCRYVNRYRLLTSEVYVKGPEFLAVKVETHVLAEAYAALDAVARDVKAALANYLDPRKWPFGKDLHPTSLYDVILDVEDVTGVEQLAVTVNGCPHDRLGERIRVPADGLVYGTDHEISVTPNRDS